jgi:predicted DNA binding CopG/RHH family protein
MSAKIKYTDEPIGDVEVVRDFLPSPEQLAFREEGVKVTLSLSKKSVDFFKAEAAKNHTQYQRMIRRLVDAYVEEYSARLPAPSTRTARKRSPG